MILSLRTHWCGVAAGALLLGLGAVQAEPDNQASHKSSTAQKSTTVHKGDGQSGSSNKAVTPIGGTTTGFATTKPAGATVTVTPSAHGAKTSPSTSSPSDTAGTVGSIISELHQAQALLQQANHDYDGFRARALGEVTAALHALRHDHHATAKTSLGQNGVPKSSGSKPHATTSTSGQSRTEPPHEPQAASDAQLQQALTQLRSVLGQINSKTGNHHASAAQHHVQSAIEDLERALKVSGQHTAKQK